MLGRKFPHLPQSQALFDAIWSEATWVQDLDEPADDNDVRLVKVASLAGAEVFITGDKRVLIWGREGNMQILSPRDAWMQLFAGNDGASKSAEVGRAGSTPCAAQLYLWRCPVCGGARRYMRAAVRKMDLLELIFHYFEAIVKITSQLRNLIV